MKRIIAVVMLVCMLFALTACGASAKSYKLGMGVCVNTSSTADANAQVDATVAAVVLDEKGAIVACRLDCAQNKMDVSAGTVDTAKEFQSKIELGDNYNMKTYGNAIGEWYEQAAAFEAYVVGKTAAEVQAIETVVNEEGHTVAVDEKLLAGCTISIEDFVAAVVRACNDDQGQGFETKDEFTLGLACNTTAAESTDAGDEDGVVKMYTEFGAAVVSGGKILACLNDAIQPQISYTKEGAVTEVKFSGTKRELKDGYNMVNYGGAVAEWYEQSAAFSAYCVGKTAAEVSAIETTVNEEGHAVAVDETLSATCTMSVDGMMAVIVKACGNAK